ncbi:hypothetical protein BDC45DRAFT_610664 [Circinella umbellata]|nr:hypothetical protein BDC45DRAFT_610664 [Circinella umbellata]
MYITYETCQWSEYSDSDGHYPRRRVQPPEKLPATIPKPAFMPSRLVRTSDMQVIYGSEVTEGYCALSYSWNWSGDMITDKKTGKYQRVDLGKHKIIQQSLEKGQQKDCNDNYHISTTTIRLVQFEDIISQVCKDFNIKYIWYDQMCINQNDKEEKMHEIRHMHRIYNNAEVTVALIPEFRIDDESSNIKRDRYDMVKEAGAKISKESQWFKRLWTLEEAIMSKKLLFVGENIHSFWNFASMYDNLLFICETPEYYKEWTVCMVLWYAHIRTSTNSHDRVFALANLFPEIIQQIKMDYDQSIIDLMVHFYGLLAQKDLTILCFGPHQEYEKIRRQASNNCASTSVSTMPLSPLPLLVDDNSSSISKGTDNTQLQKLQPQQEYQVPIQEFDLPSWTGVYGEHLKNNYITTTFKNFSIRGRFMHVTCSAISNDNITFNSNNSSSITLTHNDLASISTHDRDPVNSDGSGLFCTLAISVRLPGHEDSKIITLTTVYISSSQDQELVKTILEKTDETTLQQASRELQILSHFMPIKKENLFWHYCPYGNYTDHAQFKFDLTEESVDGTSKFVLLTGIPFVGGLRARYPVIKKEQGNDYYKAIGTIEILDFEFFFSDYTDPAEQTFIIE